MCEAGVCRVGAHDTSHGVMISKAQVKKCCFFRQSPHQPMDAIVVLYMYGLMKTYCTEYEMDPLLMSIHSW
jgi:hypothetical protein